MRFLLAAILALLPMPALADVTARYSSGKEVVIVEVDDNGNSRIDIAGKFGIIHRGGKDYAIIATPTGDTKIIELAELLSLMSGVLADAPKPEAMKLDEKFVLTSKGEASVSGRAGTLWAFGPEKESDGRPGEMLEFVMSRDPVLKPVGVLFQRTIETLKPIAVMLVPAASGFYPLALELAAKGAPLRISKAELQSVDIAAIDPKRFELPGPVVPATEFLSMMAPSSGGELSPLP